MWDEIFMVIPFHISSYILMEFETPPFIELLEWVGRIVLGAGVTTACCATVDGYFFGHEIPFLLK